MSDSFNPENIDKLLHGLAPPTPATNKTCKLAVYVGKQVQHICGRPVYYNTALRKEEDYCRPHFDNIYRILVARAIAQLHQVKGAADHGKIGEKVFAEFARIKAEIESTHDTAVASKVNKLISDFIEREQKKQDKLKRKAEDAPEEEPATKKTKLTEREANGSSNMKALGERLEQDLRPKPHVITDNAPANPINIDDDNVMADLQASINSSVPSVLAPAPAPATGHVELLPPAPTSVVLAPAQEPQIDYNATEPTIVNGSNCNSPMDTGSDVSVGAHLDKAVVQEEEGIKTPAQNDEESSASEDSLCLNELFNEALDVSKPSEQQVNYELVEDDRLSGPEAEFWQQVLTSFNKYHRLRAPVGALRQLQAYYNHADVEATKHLISNLNQWHEQKKAKRRLQK